MSYKELEFAIERERGAALFLSVVFTDYFRFKFWFLAFIFRFQIQTLTILEEHYYKTNHIIKR